MSHSQVAVNVKPFVVGPTVTHAPSHTLKNRLLDPPITIEAIDTANSTHEINLLFYVALRYVARFWVAFPDSVYEAPGSCFAIPYPFSPMDRYT